MFGTSCSPFVLGAYYSTIWKMRNIMIEKWLADFSTHCELRSKVISRKINTAAGKSWNGFASVDVQCGLVL